MPRYEFSEGTSNKFWEINLGSKSFTTTYGKIGSNGQTTIKSFGSDAEAKKEYDKVVAEKEKKGYVLVGGKGKAAAKAEPAAPAKKKAKAEPEEEASSEGARDARNEELEAAILANPNDRDAYAVLADWLQQQGDPRGELISLQLGYKDKQGKALIEKHQDYFLGPLAEHQEVYDEGNNNSRSHLRTTAQEAEWQKTQRQAFLWRNGYIHRIRLSHDDYSETGFEGELKDILAKALEHPSARFVAELAFMSNGDPNENDLQDLIDVMAKASLPTVRKLTFGDNVDQISWHHTGNLEKLWKAVPGLKTLEIETGEFDVGKMVAPALERAIFITGGMAKKTGKNIATATMPKIKHLEIYYGDDNYGGDCTVKEVVPLLQRTDLPKLEYLGLKNSQFSNDIARALAGAPVLKTVKTLDLSLGTMTDEGAAFLAAAKDSLAHLDVLDLTRNYLTKDGIKAVKGLAKKVITDKQEKADQYGDETHYYVSISE